MSEQVEVDRREQIAGRLLAGSVRRSYEPVVDMDWDAPLDPEKLFLPTEVMTLYGTPLWESMSHEQRRELSRQELANVLSVGMWFENLLNRILLRHLLSEDPTSKHAHYTLVEMGDECRHMVMFGRLIDRIGARPYWPKGRGKLLVGVLPHVIRGPLVWTAALLGEEIFDALQRRVMADPELQPLVSRLMRIHVTEEARHIRFAREALAAQSPSLPRWQREYVRIGTAVAAPLFAHLLTNPAMYRRAGLDPKEAKRQAMDNPHVRRMLTVGTASLAAFLDDVGMLGPLSQRTWRRWGFLP